MRTIIGAWPGQSIAAIASCGTDVYAGVATAEPVSVEQRTAEMTAVEAPVLPKTCKNFTCLCYICFGGRWFRVPCKLHLTATTSVISGGVGVEVAPPESPALRSIETPMAAPVLDESRMQVVRPPGRYNCICFVYRNGRWYAYFCRYPTRAITPVAVSGAESIPTPGIAAKPVKASFMPPLHPHGRPLYEFNFYAEYPHRHHLMRPGVHPANVMPPPATSAGTCGSWTQDVIDGAFFQYPAMQAAGFFDDIGKAFSDVGKSVEKAATDVAHTVGTLANDAVKVAESVANIPLTVVKQTFGAITNNPLWDIAQTGVSFIPGIGTAVSAGMATAAAIGRGAGLKDIALAAAKGALPGGPIAAAAFDIAAGVLLQGKSLDSVALDFVKSKLPGGPIAGVAFDVASAVILGKHASAQDIVLSAAKGALPKNGIVRAGFEAAAGLAKAKFATPAIIKKVEAALPPAARPSFQAGLVAGKIKQATPTTLKIVQAKVPPGPARVAVTKSIKMAATAQKVAAVHRDARTVLAHALTAQRRLGQNDPVWRRRLSDLQVRAKKGDRGATTQLAILDVAGKTLQGAKVQKAVASGELPLMLTAEAGLIGDLLQQGYQLWVGPKAVPQHHKLGLAW